MDNHDIKEDRSKKNGPLEEESHFTLLIPICSDLDSFPFVESHEIFYSRPGLFVKHCSGFSRRWNFKIPWATLW